MNDEKRRKIEESTKSFEKVLKDLAEDGDLEYKVDSSICKTCVFFYHQCYVDDSPLCKESCSNPSSEVKQRFRKKHIIKECKGYTKA